ncbi:MAG: sigma-70 family RNA polymerase sigma factor [Balneolaceae bacterium]|nr:sigma-70 family RNA polymerase sigma factor [Balneolaceae bacterium]
MDYSKLVQALQEGDDLTVNRILKDMIPRLRRYLEIHMGASRSDAEDSVQHSLELVLDALREGRLEDESHVYSYLLTTCKNNYLRITQEKREYNYDRVPSTHFNEPLQEKQLLDRERKRILEICLEELEEMYRKFIKYWLENPDYHAEMVAEHFDISVSNAWIRKHRVIKMLNYCFEKKINE